MEVKIKLNLYIINDSNSFSSYNQYVVDEANSQSDSVQTEIFKVIENAKQGKYDLLLIKDFNTFHWRTAKFCHRRNELQLPIYSLKEGYLLYEKESDFYEI